MRDLPLVRICYRITWLKKYILLFSISSDQHGQCDWDQPGICRSISHPVPWPAALQTPTRWRHRSSVRSRLGRELCDPSWREGWLVVVCSEEDGAAQTAPQLAAAHVCCRHGVAVPISCRDRPRTQGLHRPTGGGQLSCGSAGLLYHWVFCYS